MLNLLRIGTDIGYEISAPLPPPPVFALIAELGDVGPGEMWEVFNMGCGLCAIVPADSADAAAQLLAGWHRGAAQIGRLTEQTGQISLPPLGLSGDASGLRQS